MMPWLSLMLAFAEPVGCQPATVLATQPQADRDDVPTNTPLAFQARLDCGLVGMQLYRDGEFVAQDIPEVDAAGIGRLITDELQAETPHRLVLIDEGIGEIITEIDFVTGSRRAERPDTAPTIAGLAVGEPQKLIRDLYLVPATAEFLLSDPDGVSDVLVTMTSPVVQAAGLWLSDGSGRISAESMWTLPGGADKVCITASRLLGVDEPATSAEACVSMSPLGAGCDSSRSAPGGLPIWALLAAGLVGRRRAD